MVARRGRPADRRRTAVASPARPELQDGHRRPAREPERRARRAADRQGLRGPDLRPDRQPRAADGREPPATSRPSCRICAGCSPPRPEAALAGAEVAVVATSEPAVARHCVAAPPALDPRPPRAARPRSRSSCPGTRGSGGGGPGAARRTLRGPRVLIIVQNLPVPFDRRVWLECQALTAAGYDVTVVCPKGKDDPAYEVLEGVTLLQVPALRAGRRARSASSWSTPTPSSRPLRLVFARASAAAGSTSSRPATRRTSSGRSPRWLQAARRDAVRLRPPRPVPRALRLALPRRRRAAASEALLALEKATFRTADHVISTNDSYAEIAMRRGGKRPERRHRRAHRSRPERAAPGAPSPRCDAAGEHLRRLPRRHGAAGRRRPRGPGRGARRPRPGPATTSPSRCMGAGDCYDELVAAARRARTSRTTSSCPAGSPTRLSSSVLSTADVGLSPDPKNPLNDVSTMNKTLEYMAFELPVVAFDLQRDPGLGRRRRGLRRARTTSTPTPGRSCELLDDARARARAMGKRRTRSRRARVWAGRTSATRYVDGLRRALVAPQARRAAEA